MCTRLSESLWIQFQQWRASTKILPSSRKESSPSLGILMSGEGGGVGGCGGGGGGPSERPKRRSSSERREGRGILKKFWEPKN